MVRQGVIHSERGSELSELRDLPSCIVQWVVDSHVAQTTASPTDEAERLSKCVRPS